MPTVPTLHWSPLYHGVSHAKYHGRQLTVVQDAQGCVEATVFPITGTSKFWSSTLSQNFPALDEARVWCERQVGVGSGNWTP